MISLYPVVKVDAELLIDDPAEGYCFVSDDLIHCCCWWDGDGCCICDHPPMTDEEKKEQVMIDLVKPTEKAKIELDRFGIKL